MGLYIRVRRVGGRFVPFNDAVKHRALAVLGLLRPFISFGYYLKNVKVSIYRYAPFSMDRMETRPLVREVPAKEVRVLEATASTLRGLLEEAEKRWHTLYETYIVIEAIHAPPGEPEVPLYILVSNGRLGLATVELDSYDWVHGDRVVESLEESLEIIGAPTIRQLLEAVGSFHRDIQTVGYIVEKAVVAQTPDALVDLTQARAVWLPSEAKLLSYAIDTLAARADEDRWAADLYDYYQPYRRDLIVSLIGNRPEYRKYLRGPRMRDYAVVSASASIIIESTTGSLQAFFNALARDILEPFARYVLEQRKSEVAFRAREFVDRVLRPKLAGS